MGAHMVNPYQLYNFYCQFKSHSIINHIYTQSLINPLKKKICFKCEIRFNSKRRKKLLGILDNHLTFEGRIFIFSE